MHPTAKQAVGKRKRRRLIGRNRADEERKILARGAEIATSPQALSTWYTSHRIAGLGWRTPQELVRMGHGDAVLAHLDRVASGGYA